MSQENVEVIRAFTEAWNVGDMDAVGEMLDPDVILRTVGDWPEPGPWAGREAVTGFIQQLRDTWDADTVEPITDLLHGADRVVARYAWHVVGQGPQLKMEVSIVHSVRNGKVSGIEFFWDHADALEAAGLSE